MFCKLILDTILDVTRQLPVAQGPPFKLRSLRVSLTLSQQGLYTSNLKLSFDLGVHPPEELRATLEPFLHMGKNNTIQMSYISITGCMVEPCPQSGP